MVQVHIGQSMPLRKRPIIPGFTTQLVIVHNGAKIESNWVVTVVGPPAIGCVLLSPGFGLFKMRKDRRKVAWLSLGKFREGPDDK